jgi:hypothetical protein
MLFADILHATIQICGFLRPVVAARRVRAATDLLGRVPTDAVPARLVTTTSASRATLAGARAAWTVTTAPVDGEGRLVAASNAALLPADTPDDADMGDMWSVPAVRTGWWEDPEFADYLADAAVNQLPATVAHVRGVHSSSAQGGTDTADGTVASHRFPSFHATQQQSRSAAAAARGGIDTDAPLTSPPVYLTRRSVQRLEAAAASATALHGDAAAPPVVAAPLLSLPMGRRGLGSRSSSAATSAAAATTGPATTSTTAAAMTSTEAPPTTFDVLDTFVSPATREVVGKEGWSLPWAYRLDRLLDPFFDRLEVPS